MRIKKLCTVLSMLLIVCGMCFAKLSGVARASQQFNFNNNTVDYNVYATVNGSFLIDFLSLVKDSGERVGTEYPYAELGISASVGGLTAEYWFNGSQPQRDAIGDPVDSAKTGNGIVISFGENGYEARLPFWDDSHNTNPGKTFPMYVVFRIDKFRTVGNGWSLDFLGVPDAANYAKGTTFFGTGFIDFNRDALGNQNYVPCWYDFTYETIKANPRGFTFSYDDIGKIGVAISNVNRYGERGRLSMYVTAETKEMILSDSMTLTTSVSLAKKEDYHELDFGTSILLKYENEGYFSIASDIAKNDNAFGAEVYAEGGYDNFTGELYYASYADAWYYDKYQGKDKKTHGYGGTVPARQYLGARLNVDMAPYFPKLNPVLTVFGKNIINWGYENIGMKITANYSPYIMGFEAGMEHLTHGSFSGYLRVSTDFADYTDVPFSSLVFQIGDGASLDAYDIVEGLNAGIFINEVGNDEFGGGIRVSYENSLLKTDLTGKYNYTANKYAGEFNISYFISQNFTATGRIGYGSTKNARGRYEFDDRLFARAGLSYANSRLKFETAAQIVLLDQTVGFGACLGAELYIIDGATVSVTYNPKEAKSEVIHNLDSENKGILEVACTVRY